jgi:LmbE family N-acetylglucosaminyl deacetylase
MRKAIALIFIITGYFLSAYAQDIPAIEPIKGTDKIMIFAPHPDDEALGCGGIIQEAVKAGADVRIIYLTHGDHNQFAFIVYEKRLTIRQNEFIHMGEVRRKEAVKAMELLGLKSENLIFLGYPDFGTFAIFSQHWVKAKPYRSILTRISSVPYKSDFSYGFPYKGEYILSDLKSLLLLYKPNKIFVSHLADVNGDHKALPLFLEVALADLRNDFPRPKVYHYLIHSVGWPLPRHYHPELSLLPPEKFDQASVKWEQRILAPEEVHGKYQSMLCYRSQTSSSAFYLLSFCRKNELFGSAPEIDLFTSPKSSPVADFFKQLSSGKGGQKTKKAAAKPKPEDVSYRIAGGNLVITTKKRQELDRRLITVLYIFGYSYSRPFPLMPKIRIVTKYNRYKVFKEGRVIKADGIGIKITRAEFEIRIPLSFLKDPDFILVSFRANPDTLPQDALSFRKINITKQKEQ